MPEPESKKADGFSADLDLIVNAAREAGKIAMSFYRQDPQVWMKGGTSPVSEADYAADRYLRETLGTARPAYGWLSEETAERIRSDEAIGFIVDPIDGTRGFLDGNPQWCVSVAVVQEGRPVAGVLECPATGETFTALRGGGAWLNGAAITVKDDAVAPFSVGGPKAMSGLLSEQWQPEIKGIRHVPSLAYRIAMIAVGRLDATFVKPNSHDWDLAAAMLILGEAGGALLDGEGRTPLLARDDPRHGALAAGSGELLAAMVKVLSKYAPTA